MNVALTPPVSIVHMQGTQSNPYRGVRLSKMTPGGPADRSGVLQIGDQILAVNGQNVEGHGYQRVTGCY